MRPESISLKRGREGSVDPQASEAPASSHIAAKKNRLESTAAGADIVETDEDAANGKEGHTVGEVRRKVEELNWEEGAAPARDGAKADVDVDAAEESKDESKADSKAASDAADSADWVKVSKPDEDGESGGTSESESPSLKRKAGDEPEASSVASDEKKRKSTSVSWRRPPRQPLTPQPAPAKKPQATFGAFSAKSSPFASVSSSSSPFGTAAASSSPFASAASSSPAGTSGFGNYSNAFSPFAAKKPDATADADKAEASTSKSFGDILQQKVEEEKEEKVQVGEEEEETVYQTRVKLFTMEESAWKERGTGAIRLNKRRADGGGARLVMRTDGVLRVILNASLYVGMTVVEDGKHLRTTVFEGTERRFITIRTANPKVAAELSAAIQEHTPLESARSTSSPSAGAKETV
ncbi:hypothetical protein VHUM_03788 [Vanrija humicola]|uniref:RanBD1 domain-containing protein n=1 Tax=Vanrija humicola TaxID=5417 RepID=A0A7D8UZE8_VANHU|nr:hypothetical protein VHUM_03788 [Vanrija humicola]